MNIKAKIICKIIEEVAEEMGLDIDEFFEAIDHNMNEVFIGIKRPSTDEIVLYFLKDGSNSRFFLPHELS